jgi:predicted ribonuclease YlaK
MARKSANNEVITIANKTNQLRVRIDDLKTFQPLTDNQKLFFDAYKRGDYFVALHGVAGTGKTFCALYKAIEEVLDKSNPFNKIIVVRSAVQSREIGHLPGDVNEKMDIYQQPYRQICETLFGRRDAWDRLEEQHHIEFISAPHSFEACHLMMPLLLLMRCKT